MRRLLKHAISDVTIYAWRKRFGTLESVDVRRLRQQLEQENNRLKKLLAERGLDFEMLKSLCSSQVSMRRLPVC